MKTCCFQDGSHRPGTWKAKNLILDAFIQRIESLSLVIEESDDRLWAVAVDRVIVTAEGGLTFRFKDGSEVNNAMA